MAALDHPVCRVENSPGKGRGIFAARPIPNRTLIESSPVLVFSKDEYEQHGRHTILDHYTFKWNAKDNPGSMALALGLGSLFNHSPSPNLSYTLNTTAGTIDYTTTRAVAPGEELCIYYGANLWFTPASTQEQEQASQVDDGWGGLSQVDLAQPQESLPLPSFWDGPADGILPEDELPFERFKPPPEEETAETVRTVQAWAVDVPDPRNIGLMLKWLNQSGMDGPELGHLKRIRKQNGVSSFLLCLAHTPDPPSPLPSDIPLPEPPYRVTVPASAALTPTSLALKNALWPTVFAPRRKDEVETWTRGKARWAWDAMQEVVRAARGAGDEGELPIAAYVPAPYGDTEPGGGTSLSFIAHDTRTSAAHPLRHAVMNAIRQLADHHAAAEPKTKPEIEDDHEHPNGHNYLLTGLVLFTTHEPCIMCSMALLHSRVKEIVYLLPMERTGGCGGATCLPLLPNVNHRFGFSRWKTEDAKSELRIDDTIDA